MKATRILVPALLLFLSTTARASDDNGFGTLVPGKHMLDDVVEVDIGVADIVNPVQSQADGYRTLFVNPCEGGITVTRGYNDSRTNSSSIIDQTRTFAAYPYGDASWDQVMADVRDMLLPYGIIITDEDPGNEPHTEILVCGRSFRGNNVLGVAPFGCGVVQNAIGYAFAENHSNSPRQIAETIVHEAGHTFSLNHLYDCEDPMTYLNGCGEKYFQDAPLNCAAQTSSGQWVTQSCSCGGATQNSHQTLMSAFGPRDIAAPGLSITAPMDGAEVKAGFPVRATPVSEANIAAVRLHIDGEFIAEVTSAPWVFNAPDDLSDGTHEVTVEVEDQFGGTAIASVTVLQGEPCQCQDAQVCVDGGCIAGPDTQGGLGTACSNDGDCLSSLCGQSDDGGFCTATCSTDGLGCPSGFDCLEASDGSGVCWTTDEPETSGCGCGVGSSRGSGASFLLFFLVAFVLRRSRR